MRVYRSNIPTPIYYFCFLCLLIVIGLFIYWPSITGPFVFDDDPNIVFNRSIRIDKISFNELWDASANSPLKNRIIPNISFAINYYLGDLNPAGYKIFNIIVHILCAFFLFCLFHQILYLDDTIEDKVTIAFIASILWFCHPLQIQSVSYVVQRMNSIAALFYLISVLCYIKFRLLSKKINDFAMLKAAAFFTLSVILLIFAVFSKENAIMIPVFLIVVEYFFLSKSFRDDFFVKSICVFFSIVLLILLAQLLLGDKPLSSIIQSYINRDFDVLQRCLTQCRVLFFYLSLLLYPHPDRLSLEHQFSISSGIIDPLTTPFAMFGVAIMMMASIMLIKKNKIVSFSILWFLGNMVPESSVLGLEIVFEHRMYLPSMMLFLLSVYSIHRHISLFSRYFIIFLYASVVIVLCIWTFERNTVWGSRLSLYFDIVKKAPMKPRPYINLGTELAKNGMIAEAQQCFEKALALDHNYYAAYYSLAMIYRDDNLLDMAVDNLLKSIELKPENPLPWFELAKIYMIKGFYNRAEEAFSKAINLPSIMKDLYLGESLFYLGVIKRKDKDIWAAADYFQKAVDYEPNNINFLKAAADTFMVLSDYDKSMALFENALELSDTDEEVYYFSDCMNYISLMLSQKKQK